MIEPIIDTCQAVVRCLAGIPDMPIEISGERYYRTSEAAKKAGISRSTLLRWIGEGIFKDDSRRDRRGWRLFTQADLARLQEEAGKFK
jgi:hypothetical protein